MLTMMRTSAATTSLFFVALVAAYCFTRLPNTTDPKKPLSSLRRLHSRYLFEKYDKMLENHAVAKVTQKRFHAYLEDLVGFYSRASQSAYAASVESYLDSKLRAMGYQVCMQDVPIYISTPHNVLAFAPGSAPAGGSMVVVGAHFDSRPFVGGAPGANDNGSGTAALLAMAEAYSEVYRAGGMPNTVVFAAFTGEEEGLYGSTKFVSELKMSKICGQPTNSLLAATYDLNNVLGTIIMTEIGWASPKFHQHTLTLESKEFSGHILDELAASSMRHNGASLDIRVSYHPFGSDHMPFLNEHAPAVLTINGDDEAYPYYHMSTDTIENIDETLALKIAKMNLGAMIRLAQQ